MTATRQDPDLFSALDPVPVDPMLVVSWGLGVDSSAYLCEVLEDPDRHGVDLSRMVVLHAVVGSEWEQTYLDAERYLLPLLADRGVRTVQVARGGRYQSSGIVVLDDTIRPTRVHRRGPWTLHDEMRLNGTVPQLSNRKCSYKFKGWVIDQWIARTLGTAPYDHVIGYSSEETRRAAKDEVYATATRTPRHPLIEWGWNRAACLLRLQASFGITWSKSACVFCPFSGQKSLESTLERMRLHPQEAVTALLLEAPAIALNPRSRLYGTHSLADRLAADGNTTALDLFHKRVEARPWSLYEVRRFFLPHSGDPMVKGSSWRSVVPVFTGTAEQARARLAAEGVVEDGRVWQRRQDETGPFPRAEQFLVATTAGVSRKHRPGFPERWQYITGEPLLQIGG